MLSVIVITMPVHHKVEPSKIYVPCWFSDMGRKFDTVKLLGKSLTFAAASAALAAGFVAPATPAGAATPQPTSGMVTIKVDPSSRTVVPATTVDVGGGSWTYGTELVTGGKRCYSYYFHGSKLHHATAIIADAQNSAYQPGGYTAKASATAGAAYTCHAYWSVDE
ncbi:lactococcin 972 family bacteriocin [Streptomyces sp. NPDC093675]|uniref:lactococcin 972 family bacteriocin n=1 Tax=Streptomyces sp. NPDC093675 TaxID=3366049 RepID=UPI003828C73A